MLIYFATVAAAEFAYFSIIKEAYDKAVNKGYIYQKGSRGKKALYGLKVFLNTCCPFFNLYKLSKMALKGHDETVKAEINEMIKYGFITESEDSLEKRNKKDQVKKEVVEEKKSTRLGITKILNKNNTGRTAYIETVNNATEELNEAVLKQNEIMRKQLEKQKEELMKSVPIIEIPSEKNSIKK